MAYAKKCDRCGSYYEHNVRIRGPKGGCLGSIATRTGDGNVIKLYDLCDDCAEAVDKFLKEYYNAKN